MTTLFDQGIGHVIVTRFKVSGEAEIGVFLVDVFCLGVKGAATGISISSCSLKARERNANLIEARQPQSIACRAPSGELVRWHHAAGTSSWMQENSRHVIDTITSAAVITT